MKNTPPGPRAMRAWRRDSLRSPPSAPGSPIAAADQQFLAERDLLALLRSGRHPEHGNRRRHLGHRRRGARRRHVGLRALGRPVGRRSSSNVDCPTRSTSPVAQTCAAVSRCSLTHVPLVDPRSSTIARPCPSTKIRAWRRDSRCVTAEVAGIGFLAPEHEFGVDRDRLAGARTDRAPQRHSHFRLPQFLASTSRPESQPTVPALDEAGGADRCSTERLAGSAASAIPQFSQKVPRRVRWPQLAHVMIGASSIRAPPRAGRRGSPGAATGARARRARRRSRAPRRSAA